MILVIYDKYHVLYINLYFMQLSTIDLIIIATFFLVFMIIGILLSKNASKSGINFFLSGRNMPWWLLGISMVATTFSADTPNLVTQIIREDGISGNWVWWTFLLTGMLTVFVYARLWRRSEVLTDLAFYEIRYSGKAAAFLRGFRALYLGVFFNVMIMASVCLAAIKIGSVLFGLEAWESVLYASIITVFYSMLGGLKGVIITDFIQFIIAMIGAVWAAMYIIDLPEIQGLENLLAHKNVASQLNFLPSLDNKKALVTLLIIPIAVQWWSVWYPGAEPGGGGYIAQRMLSAKNEKHAIGATFLFNIAHYALRPWPWIIIALASIIIFPDLSSIQKAFPNVNPSLIGNDIAYPAMLSRLPSGLLGLVTASLISAFMSTISTHLNWGASYIALDFYKRFVKPECSEKEIVKVGKLSTIVLMLLSAILALFLKDAMDAFGILLQIGAGTGLIFILRWFWWRVNAYSEISGMIISFLVAVWFQWGHEAVFNTTVPSHIELILSTGISTVVWIVVTLLSPPTDDKVLAEFYHKVQPYGVGWDGFLKRTKQKVSYTPKTESPINDIASMFLGLGVVYCCLFGIGLLIYGELTNAATLLLIAALCALGIYRIR